jgi:hypothetical protein
LAKSFYAAELGWTPANELQSGMELQTASGEWIRMDGMDETTRMGSGVLSPRGRPQELKGKCLLTSREAHSRMKKWGLEMNRSIEKVPVPLSPFLPLRIVILSGANVSGRSAYPSPESFYKAGRIYMRITWPVVRTLKAVETRHSGVGLVSQLTQ